MRHIKVWIALFVCVALVLGSVGSASADGGRGGKSSHNSVKTSSGSHGKSDAKSSHEVSSDDHEKKSSHKASTKRSSDDDGRKSSHRASVKHSGDDDDDDDRESKSRSKASISGEAHEKITICHRTSSSTNPFVMITISKNGLHGHGKHEGDIVPAPAGGCPDATVQAASANIARADDDKKRSSTQQVTVKVDGDDEEREVVVTRNLNLVIHINGDHVVVKDLDDDLDLTGHINVRLLLNGQQLVAPVDLDRKIDLSSLKFTIVVDGKQLGAGGVASGIDAAGNLVLLLTPDVPQVIAAPPASFVIANAPSAPVADIPLTTEAIPSVMSTTIVPAADSAAIVPAADSAGIAPAADSSAAGDGIVSRSDSAQITPGATGNGGLLGAGPTTDVAAGLVLLAVVIAAGVGLRRLSEPTR